MYFNHIFTTAKHRIYAKKPLCDKRCVFFYQVPFDSTPKMIEILGNCLIKLGIINFKKDLRQWAIPICALGWRV